MLFPALLLANGLLCHSLVLHTFMAAIQPRLPDGKGSNLGIVSSKSKQCALTVSSLVEDLDGAGPF